MPTPLGYFSENNQSIYPFKDGIELPFPRDLIADFQLSTSDDTVKIVGLTHFAHEKSPAQFVLTIGLFGINYHIDQLVLTIVDADAIPYKTITYTSQKYKVKLVLGRGIINYINPKNIPIYHGIALEFCASTLALAVPQVLQTVFMNLPNTVVKTFSGTDTIKVECGSNLTVADGDSSYTLDVEAGGGSGLYNICADNEVAYSGAIREINNIRANSDGNFSFGTDQCYNTEYESINGVLSSKLILTHTCHAKCTQDHINAYAYYLNRVNDSVSKLADYAGGTRVDNITLQLSTQMERYASMVAEKAAFVGPDVAVIPVVSSGIITEQYQKYISIAASLYSPNEQSSISYYIKPTPMPGANYYYIPNTANLVDDGNLISLTPVEHLNLTGDSLISLDMFTDRVIHCGGTVHATAVIKANSSTLPLGWDKDHEFQIYLYDSNNLASAYKYFVVSPGGEYFTLKSRRVNIPGTATCTYHITIDVMSASISTGNQIKTSTLSFAPISGQSSMASVFTNAKFNGVAATTSGTRIFPTTTSTGPVSTLDYAKRNTFTFDVVSYGITSNNVIVTLKLPISGQSRQWTKTLQIS